MSERTTPEYYVRFASYIIDRVGETVEDVRKYVPKRIKSAFARFIVETLSSAEEKAKIIAEKNAISKFKREYQNDLLRDLGIALEYLDRAKKSDPKIDLSRYYALAHHYMGVIYDLAEDYKRALNEAEKVVQYAPTDIEGYDDFVTALYNCGKRKESIEVARRGIQVGIKEIREIQSLEESERKKIVLSAASRIASLVEIVDKDEAIKLYDEIADATSLEPIGLEAALSAERLRFRK